MQILGKHSVHVIIVSIAIADNKQRNTTGYCSNRRFKTVTNSILLD